MASLLIIDDDIMFRDPLVYYLEQIGHGCDVASSLAEGTAKAYENNYDIIFLDVILPDVSGLKGLAGLKKAPSAPEVIIITGQGDRSGAEIALTNGAWDYLQKPPHYPHLKLLVERALEYRRQKRKSEGQRLLNRDFIIGNHPALRDCLEVVAQAAETDGGVYISGETGTGKELMAKAVHLNSIRKTGDFVTVDCTNIPANLVESLLFGHRQGAFTGAVRDQEGLIRQAEKGTLFFDEIGDLHPSAQKAVLGVLQRKRYRPLGGKHEQACDFRVIAASNCDLKQMVAQGSFRRDLYYRLVAFHIHLPPLRERRDDIRPLVTHYVDRICHEFGIHTKGVSRDIMEQLRLYDWPGNIRELINVLHTSIAKAGGEPVLYPHHLPVDIRVWIRQKSLTSASIHVTPQAPVMVAIDRRRFPTLAQYRRQTEARYLEELIGLAAGKPNHAYQMAGISRSSLYNLLEKHGLKICRNQISSPHD